ncbi:hypothetical protein [Flavobacterium aquiphilum]|uniref:hypothetical protein n=1 Tax=Flavobacterium aquiphilum TaxID=3003261 RepID=UPI0024807024|nr:hypothetical protein [Flavobacterium aquiphilum]
MNIIYQNNFGTIHKDRIILNLQNKKKAIQLENIIKITFVKRQKLHLNYLLLFIAFFLFSFKNNSISSFEKLLFILFAFIFLIISYYLKLFQYKLVVLKTHGFEIIKITKNLSRDALDLTNQFNDFSSQIHSSTDYNKNKILNYLNLSTEKQG